MGRRVKVNKVLLQALKKERHRYAFDANLYRLGVETGPHFKAWHDRYVELTAEIERVERGEPVLRQSEFGI